MTAAEGLRDAPVPTHRGRMVVIVGASGCGKDTLIAWLRERLADRSDIQFVRRTVTRQADAALEDHDTMSPEEFSQAHEDGRFAVTWQAHGLCYALPASALDHVRRGGIAVSNGSRSAIGDIEKAFGNVVVVQLTVDIDVLRARLQKRGRESPAEIEKRLQRAADAAQPGSSGHVIDNSGPIEVAGGQVLELIGKFD